MYAFSTQRCRVAGCGNGFRLQIVDVCSLSAVLGRGWGRVDLERGRTWMTIHRIGISDYQPRSYLFLSFQTVDMQSKLTDYTCEKYMRSRSTDIGRNVVRLENSWLTVVQL